jgi:hypothetical protein
MVAVREVWERRGRRGPQTVVVVAVALVVVTLVATAGLA